MADTGGIAALMKALNDTPSLGSGLKSTGVAKTNGVARPSRASSSTSVSTTGASFSRPFSAAAATSGKGSVQLPKILQAEGQGYDPKAPRGSYVDMVV